MQFLTFLQKMLILLTLSGKRVLFILGIIPLMIFSTRILENRQKKKAFLIKRDLLKEKWK